MIAALVALLAAAQPVYYRESVNVPPNEWRALEFAIDEAPARIACEFALMGGGGGVRAALLRREDVGRFREGRAHRVLAGTGFAQKGGFRYEALDPGPYALVIDNRMEGRGWAEVAVNISVTPLPARRLARELPPRRRAVVIAVSLAFFIGVAWYARRKMRSAVDSQPASSR